MVGVAGNSGSVDQRLLDRVSADSILAGTWAAFGHMYAADSSQTGRGVRDDGVQLRPSEGPSRYGLPPIADQPIPSDHIGGLIYGRVTHYGERMTPTRYGDTMTLCSPLNSGFGIGSQSALPMIVGCGLARVRSAVMAFFGWMGKSRTSTVSVMSLAETVFLLGRQSIICVESGSASTGSTLSQCRTLRTSDAALNTTARRHTALVDILTTSTISVLAGADVNGSAANVETNDSELTAPESALIEGRVTHYGESYNGRPLGCPGEDNYSSAQVDIAAVSPLRYADWPCGSVFRVCGPGNCIRAVRRDACPGCDRNQLDLSEAGIAIVCGSEEVGTCEVTIEVQ